MWSSKDLLPFDEPVGLRVRYVRVFRDLRHGPSRYRMCCSVCRLCLPAVSRLARLKLRDASVARNHIVSALSSGVHMCPREPLLLDCLGCVLQELLAVQLVLAGMRAAGLDRAYMNLLPVMAAP